MLSTPLLLPLVILSLSFAFVYFIQTQRERDRLKQELHKHKQKLHRYESLTSREETEKKLDANIQLKRTELEELEDKIKKSESYLRELRAKEYLIKIDEYEPKYDFVNSEDYMQRIQQNRLNQERMLKENKAYICDNYDRLEFGENIGQSERESKKLIKAGNQIINGIIKTVKLAFEEKCKYAIKQVKYNNVDSLKKRIKNTFNTINKYLQDIGFRITEEYLQLKLEELNLKYEFEEKEKEEKEREKELKKLKKEREDIEKAQQEVEEAEENEKRHQQELDKLRHEMKQLAEAEVEKRKQIELEYEKLEQKLIQDRSDKDKANQKLNKVKWGYIYIISNIGSFQEQDVYRICMTNRQSEDSYIRDMNPAVPFQFDIHFKIFSQDVYDTLKRLHNCFNDKRVNTVNFRRDFFKVSLNEIEQAVEDIKRETGILRIDKFEPEPKANEYHQTIAARQNKSNDIK